ncbi:MAG: hypothetical protein V7641_3698 [Blastocatellia bacterium]
MINKTTVLLLATNQLEIAYVRLDDELREIDEKIHVARFGNSFEFESRPAIKVSELRSLLFRYKPHIIHFSGHGRASGEIILEDDAGGMRITGVDELIGILRTIKDNLRLAVFNVCYSKAYAEAFAETFDYAVGMDGLLDRSSAIVFAGSFYQALAFGRSVREAFDAAKEQLTIRALAGANVPVLLIRPGAPDAEPFIFPHKNIEEMSSVLRRLIEGIANPEDRLILQRGISEGSILLEEREDVSVNAEEAETPYKILVRDHQLHISLSPPAYRLVRAKVLPPPPGLPPPLPHSVFIGREGALEDVKRLLENVKAPAGQANISVVRGWPGVGKTSLVGVIGRDAEVATMYPQGVLWTSLEKHPNLLSEFARWGRALGTDDILRAPTLKEATARLADLLRHRRMLLIVDDVWYTEHAVPFMEIMGKECALLVTTRMTKVAEDLTRGEERIYLLPGLTEENGLKLLRILAPAIVEHHHDECRELVRELECLPLGLHVAGNLLKSEARMGWGVSELLREIHEGAKLMQARAPLDRIQGETIPTVSALLMKSTDMLDDFTRECFAFLGAFSPKPATFDLAAMKAVWEVDDPKPIVRKLVGHGLLEPMESGRFQMHSLLVDHANSLCT